MHWRMFFLQSGLSMFDYQKMYIQYYTLQQMEMDVDLYCTKYMKDLRKINQFQTVENDRKEDKMNKYSHKHNLPSPSTAVIVNINCKNDRLMKIV